MRLKRQFRLENWVARYMFEQVFDTKLKRLGDRKFKLEELTSWKVSVYFDGPLTFATLLSPYGEAFTGWAKFNANDHKYSEEGGAYRAIARACDKLLESLPLIEATPQSQETHNEFQVDPNRGAYNRALE